MQRSKTTALDDLVLLCLVGAAIVVMFGIVGCAGMKMPPFQNNYQIEQNTLHCNPDSTKNCNQKYSHD